MPQKTSASILKEMNDIYLSACAARAKAQAKDHEERARLLRLYRDICRRDPRPLPGAEAAEARAEVVADETVARASVSTTMRIYVVSVGSPLSKRLRSRSPSPSVRHLPVAVSSTTTSREVSSSRLATPEDVPEKCVLHVSGPRAARAALELLIEEKSLRHLVEVVKPRGMGEEEVLPPNVTHVVMCGHRSDAVYVGLVRGCWVVTPAYVEAVAAKGAWVPESEFGFRLSRDAVPFRGKHTLLLTPGLRRSDFKIQRLARELQMGLQQAKSMEEVRKAAEAQGEEVVIMGRATEVGVPPSTITPVVFLRAIFPEKEAERLGAKGTGRKLPAAATTIPCRR